MKPFIAALAFIAAPHLAMAQAACPVPVTINDVGVPSWLDADSVLSNLQSKRAWIDVEYRDASGGMLIGYVEPNSPAQQAGLTPGAVITQINGVDTKDIAARDEMLASVQNGDSLRMHVRISGSRHLMNVPARAVDPVPSIMASMLETQDCVETSIFSISGVRARDLQEQMFTEDRKLNCSEAHVTLASIGSPDDIDDVYVVRDSSTILITMPHWGTACVPASAMDGSNLQPTVVIGILNSVIGDYIASKAAD